LLPGACFLPAQLVPVARMGAGSHPKACPLAGHEARRHPYSGRVDAISHASDRAIAQRDPGRATGGTSAPVASAPRPAALLAMQRAAGNHAVTALLHPPAAAPPVPTLHPAVDAVVQREREVKRPRSGMRVVGELVITDRLTGEPVGTTWKFQLDQQVLGDLLEGDKPIRSGSFHADVDLSGDGDNIKLRWAGHELPLDMISDKAGFRADVAGAKKFVLILQVPGGSVLKEDYEAGKLAPGSEVESGAGGEGGEATGGKREETTGAGGQRKEGGAGGTSASEGTTAGGKKGRPPAGRTREGGKEGATGTGNKPGSKYGWLGWLELDQDTIDVLESIFEAMGDSAEFLALKRTLETLTQLGEHADELPALLQSDELVKMVLGLESEAVRGVVTALETWVGQETPANPESTDASRKGIAAMAAKLLRLVRKLRTALRPVFAARTLFQATFGVLQAALADVDSFSALLDHLGGKTLPPDALAALTQRIGQEGANKFVTELRQVREEVVISAERFSTAELIKREDVARAIVAGAAMATPKLYKPIVWVLQKADVDRLVADNLIDDLIPSRAVEAVNDALAKISAPLTDASRNLTKRLDLVFAGAEKLAAEKIPAAITAALPSAVMQRVDTAALLGDHLASLSGTAVMGLAAAQPKAGDTSLKGAAVGVDAWLASNEKRDVVSSTSPLLPPLYYRYVPATSGKKPRMIVRTPKGVIARVPPLMIYMGKLWRKGRVISEGRDALGQLTITSELGPPSGRRGYEQLLPLGTEVLGRKDWERAHSHGNIIGAESREGIRLAPKEVNQTLQRLYVEGHIAEIVRQKAPGVRIQLTTETTTWERTLRLQRIQYILKLSHPGDSKGTEVFVAWIAVSDSLDEPKPTYGVDYLATPERLEFFLAPMPTRLGGGTSKKAKKKAKKK
jgi:hypothetical protein